MLHYFIALLASIVTPALAYPLVSNNTLQEGLVPRMNTQSPSEVHREVHPCRSTFSPYATKLYTDEYMTLQECTTRRKNGRIGIAFWPLDLLECGLVWPDMVLIGGEGTKYGTCYVGPQNATDTTQGLSPCQPHFDLKRSPFYDWFPHQVPPPPRRPRRTGYPRWTRPPRRTRPPRQTISLAVCRATKHAVAWRAVSGPVGSPGTCITLPLNEWDHDMNVKPGYCALYNGTKYQDWYFRQAIKTEEREVYRSWKAVHAPDSDWVERPLLPN